MSSIATDKIVIYGVRHGWPSYIDKAGVSCDGGEHLDIFFTERAADKAIMEWISLITSPFFGDRPDYVYKVRFTRSANEERKL